MTQRLKQKTRFLFPFSTQFTAPLQAEPALSFSPGILRVDLQSVQTPLSPVFMVGAAGQLSPQGDSEPSDRDPPLFASTERPLCQQHANVSYPASSSGMSRQNDADPIGQNPFAVHNTPPQPLGRPQPPSLVSPRLRCLILKPRRVTRVGSLQRNGSRLESQRRELRQVHEHSPGYGVAVCDAV